MLKLLIRQSNWGILGSVFAFIIGFIVKTFVIREVGTIEWGKYVTAHTFAMLSDTILSFGIPYVILKFFPVFIKDLKDKSLYYIQIILRFSLWISFVFLIIMYFLSPFLDKYIYINSDNFSYLLLVISIHAPISVLMGVINSLFRASFKIKEIVLYGTFISVSIRAILTFL